MLLMVCQLVSLSGVRRVREELWPERKGQNFHLQRDDKAPNLGTGTSVSKRRFSASEPQSRAGPFALLHFACAQSSTLRASICPLSPCFLTTLSKDPWRLKKMMLHVRLDPVWGTMASFSLDFSPDSLSTSASLPLHICVPEFILYLQLLCGFAGFSVLFSLFFWPFKPQLLAP